MGIARQLQNFKTILVPLPGGAYDVDGVAPLEEIEETLKISLHANNMRTVAGFLIGRLGRIPKPGDRITESGYSFTIVEVMGPKVRKVRIQRETPSHALRPNAPKKEAIRS